MEIRIGSLAWRMEDVRIRKADKNDTMEDEERGHTR